MAEEPLDLSHLAPNAVLGTVPLNREELIKAAADAPDTQLILPELPKRTPLPEPPLAPAITNLVAPVLPVAVVKEVPKPPLPTPDIEVIMPQEQVKHGPSTARIGLIVAVAVLAIVVVAAGVLVAMVIQGTRIPLLYKAISHLEPTGLKERDSALAQITKQSSYQYESGTSQGLDGLSSTVDNGWVRLSDTTAYLSEHVKGSNVEIPLLYRSGTPAIISFPLVKPIVRQQVANDLKKSPLYLALQPVPVAALLQAVSAEMSYHSSLTDAGSSQRVATYEYSVDTSKLSMYLPADYELTSPLLTVLYGWGSDLPLSITLTGTLTGVTGSKEYRSTSTYGQWGSSFPDQFATLDASSSQTVSLQDLLAQLGATSPTPGNTSKPLPFTPLTPSHSSVNALGTVVAALPPPPAIATDPQATNRDTIRKADLALLRAALIGYKTATGGYPVSSGSEQVQASQVLFTALLPTYLTAMPVDPLSTTYWYEYQSDGVVFSLRSVAENPSDAQAKLGKAYHYFILNN